MEDGMIEIDPELFMSCRLCIEEKGKFQIVPSLQQKIKFCLDINVNLFDGLSQLICGKCKAVIHEYSKIKETFKTKQASLLAKTRTVSLGIALDTVSSSQPDNEECQPNNDQDHPDHALGPEESQDQHNDGQELLNDQHSDASQHQSDHKSNKRKKKKRRKKQKVRTRTISSSNSEDEIKCLKPTSVSEEIHVESIERDNKKREPSIISDKTNGSNWTDLYHRTFVCRYCSISSSHKKSIRDHVRRHSALQRIRHSQTRAHCFVNLERFDEKQNFTGQDNIVVLGPNKLISDIGSADYYVSYTVKAAATTKLLNKEESSNSDADTVILNNKRFTCMDITSSDEDMERPKLRKRIRLMSPELSDDENDNESDMTQNEPYNVEQYGGSDICKILYNASEHPNDNSDQKDGSLNVKQSIQVNKKKKKEVSDYKIIHNIVSLSFQKFSKKRIKHKNVLKSSSGLLNKPDDIGFLNRKVLSIGRKTLHKEGHVSMGLLKYLKQKELNIEWNHIAPHLQAGKDYVRIMPKIMNKKLDDNLTGFETVLETEHHETMLENLIHFVPPASHTTNKEQLLGNNVFTPSVPFENINSGFLLPALPSAVLSNQSPQVTIQKKNAATVPGILLSLLNTKPAANPKKPPKKKSSGRKENHDDSEVKGKTKSKVSPETPVVCINLDDESPNDCASVSSNLNLNVVSGNVDTSMPIITSTTSYNVSYQNDDENNLKNPGPASCMPIITGTTSLANMETKSSDSNLKSETNSSNIIPKIKCKPVSELMGNVTLKADQSPSTSKTSFINTTTPRKGAIVPASIPQGIQPGNDTTPVPVSTVAVVQPTVRTIVVPPGHVILHTVSLPNTLTNSPFNYFKKLLGIHSLNLLDCTASGDSLVSLARFRLGVHQYPASVVLSLILEARGTNFRLIIFNQDKENVNMKDMSALWQWEVLKAFQATSVIDKILMNSKALGTDNENAVKLFISLLKSIELHTNRGN